MGDLNPRRDAFDELFDAFVERGRENRELRGEMSQLKSGKEKEITALKKENFKLGKKIRALEDKKIRALEDTVRESEEADGLKKELRQNEGDLRRERLEHMFTALRADRLEEDVKYSRNVKGRAGGRWTGSRGY